MFLHNMSAVSLKPSHVPHHSIPPIQAWIIKATRVVVVSLAQDVAPTPLKRPTVVVAVVLLFGVKFG